MIAIISPHRDDVAFSLSLAVEAWLLKGHSVAVLCCFTRSTYAPYRPEAAESISQRIKTISALRAHEDLIWIESFYHTKLFMTDLALEDAPMRLGCSELAVCGFPPGDLLATRSAIQDAVRASQADALVLPLALGDHVDHVTAREAAIHVATRVNLPVAFYEDLPYAARPGVAKKIRSAATTLPFDLSPAFVENPRDPYKAFERKMSVALGYPSQIDANVAREIAEFSSRYGGRERLWVSRAWRESGLYHFDDRQDVAQSV